MFQIVLNRICNAISPVISWFQYNAVEKWAVVIGAISLLLTILGMYTSKKTSLK